ncbi:MAPEG family protein [Aquipseudomonas ullengensis]|uniref:MAPEG family protein n=1 Tax=Aquipseudomonas ullengensis TaxID=2759166 RepID=A0A7W4LJ49_9GAMM|nr:MAPEG family protein [Pseudomonas ullengensis]MBB2494134.1 MAPEG family protein [Pseudomonas ullengensis]
MTISVQLLGPVIALVAWTMVMWLWMYATRLPAMRAASMKPDSNAPRGEQMSSLPARVRWKADNYNHLLEQPTLFYALAISLALLGVQSPTCLLFAWAYVVLRIGHSLLQTLVNKIEIRFLLFALSNIPLFALTYMAVIALLNAPSAA